MASAKVACPKCKKTFKASDEVKDKRIRCPLCGFGFAVKEFVRAEEPPPADAKAKADAEEDDDADPYGVKNISLVPRCPNCANEMESEVAVICLYCGYNTQTRTLGKTKRVVHQSGVDKTKWRMPAVLCLAGLFALVLLQTAFVLGLGAAFRADERWLWKMLFSEPAYLWLTLMVAGVMWVVGRFVFNRLILEPTPPEDVIE